MDEFINLAKKRELEISKKKKGIQNIKDEVETLPDLKKLTENFENKCFTPILDIIKDNETSEDIKKELQAISLDMAALHSAIKEKDKINENLSVLAYYLPHLKIHLLRDDEKQLDQVLKKFLSNDTNIKKTVSMVQNFKTELSGIESAYNKASQIISSTKLEHNILVNDCRHNLYIDKLYDAHTKQKELIYHIGKEFITLSKKLQNKE